MYMTEPEKQQFLGHWDARRANGKTRFIIRTTLAYFAIMVVVAILIDLVDQSLAEAIADNLAPHKLIFKTLFGALMGALEWHSNERLYRRLRSRQM